MHISEKELVVAAPAKINLYLEVTGRRANGYHDLATFMQKIELADTLALRVGPGEGVRFSTTSSALPLGDDNLAVRAARAFLQAAGVTGAVVDIALEKRIPIAAGLGGGSSDAAAVLSGLNRIFAGVLSNARLQELALDLGADVPFLVSGCAAAWATGVGERLTEATPLADCWILLVNPGFPVATKWVFETFDRLVEGNASDGGAEGGSAQPQMAASFRNTDSFALTTGGNPYILGREKDRTIKTEQCLDAGKVRLWNDLETVTIGRYHALGEIKAKLFADGASGALMSGSGPTVFGLFDDEQQAIASFSSFAERYGGNVFLTRPLQAM